ncbi:AraC family transcriptional regulator [Glycomyces albidus]|jgi:AraC-like DNA-binding protein|uniref:Helix-turn-helix domain-containing protein n=1 Tax=Glycomyces albidus TaxID=2656774 RepID=A0A6L5GAB3_9ACTN|nr:AraC family transcriptional regulator [Glycomyces albidus]MQM26617.1 helix-turn-helix domain-containing protein [Glycomyces albidus]
MDPLSELLGGIRAEGALLSGAILKAPWVVGFDDRAPLTMISVARGGGVILLADGTEVPLKEGQTAVVRGHEPFRMADDPASVERSHLEYWLTCFDPEACGPAGVGDPPGGPGEATDLYVGAYRASGRRHERLMRALPPVLVIDDPTEVCVMLDASIQDFASRKPGTQAYIDRLFDWGLVCTLRTWFDQQGEQAPAWYRGFADPVAGPALEAIHTRLSAPWTVAGLATEAGVSRALLAKRFNEIMGEPPLTYLTERRMERAEELLADPELTVAQVARIVGYADQFGFSNAFKRRKGTSPTAYRAANRHPVAV